MTWCSKDELAVICGFLSLGDVCALSACCKRLFCVLYKSVLSRMRPPTVVKFGCKIPFHCSNKDMDERFWRDERERLWVVRRLQFNEFTVMCDEKAFETKLVVPAQFGSCVKHVFYFEVGKKQGRVEEKESHYFLW